MSLESRLAKLEDRLEPTMRTFGFYVNEHGTIISPTGQRHPWLGRRVDDVRREFPGSLIYTCIIMTDDSPPCRSLPGGYCSVS